MIKVTRWVDDDPAVMVLSADDADGSRPELAARAWSNGAMVHCSVGHLELAMPRGVWEQVCVEVRDVLRTAPPPVLSVVGKNAGDAKVYTGATVTHFPLFPEGLAELDEPEPTLAERLADILGFGAGTDEATDDALLDVVRRLKQMHTARVELSRLRTPEQVTAAAYIEFDGSM